MLLRRITKHVLAGITLKEEFRVTKRTRHCEQLCCAAISQCRDAVEQIATSVSLTRNDDNS